MTEFVITRYGAWAVTVSRVDVKAFGGTKPPLFFWAVVHDESGVVYGGASKDLDLACDHAQELLGGLTGQEA